MNENQLKRNIVKKIKENYPGSWTYVTSDRFQLGIPDIICCIHGVFFAFEVKDPKRKGESDSRDMQEYNIKMIHKAGGFAAFVETIHATMFYINQNSNGRR